MLGAFENEFTCCALPPWNIPVDTAGSGTSELDLNQAWIIEIAEAH